ncbi:hypothetical protein STVIR_8426 [Streptomyces viridochromogenes Tue57]|uniref:Uncharacterized protein n=1 Tax=Streptomyces viridochromogenes Tue57 TaxID=1160705 RepID=L8P294_STRVR|nr:hypothetical protein STVIR_8426 [Streptomyces viridochromogenes Tue57]
MTARCGHGLGRTGGEGRDGHGTAQGQCATAQLAAGQSARTCCGHPGTSRDLKVSFRDLLAR